MKKKIVSLVLVFALALALGIGGTVAWLTAQTSEVVNTFTVGDIEIELTETGTDNAGKKNYSFIPGDKLAKDPKVTVKANSEACWVFIKVNEAHNTHTALPSGEKIINWSVASDWTQVVDGSTKYNVWYKEFAATGDTPVSKYILTGDGTGEYANGFVTVNGNVTEVIAESIDGDANGENKPQLTFDAFAHQSKNTNIETATAAALAHFAAETNQ